MPPSILSQRPSPRQLRVRSQLANAALIWAPVVLAVLVIAIESTGTFSGEHTSGWLRPLFEAVFGRFEDQRWGEVHHLLRKTGHFIGYGLVCLTWLRAWLYTLAGQIHRSLAARRTRAVLYAILSTALIASIDEVHQTMLPGRTGRYQDVMLDTCGATVLCLLIWLLFWRSPKPLKSI